MDQFRTCKRCNGTGVQENSLHSFNPEKYPNPTEPCRRCEGLGTYSAPDFKAIIAALVVTRKGKRTFRASKPKGSHSDQGFNRTYYVWRLARFHGGADVTMPMTATLFIEGDPFEPELDALASLIAQNVFGTDKAAAYRWGHALGMVNSIPDGLPGSAYPCGPVADGNKPLEELAELI